MSVVAQLADLLAPWQSVYANSTAVSTAVTALHVVSMLVGGGLAIAADRMTLRVLRRDANQRRAHLVELHAVHTPVIIALCGLVASGMMQAAADIEEFAAAPVYWCKMLLFVVLLANGLMMRRAESQLAENSSPATSQDAAWHRLGIAARVSVALWITIAVLGVVLLSA